MSDSVTILSFGPSLFGKPMEVRGSVWSMNACYDVFMQPQNAQLMSRLSTVFEMHRPSKVLGALSVVDGMTHREHLRRLTENGVRVVMQDVTPDVPRSVKYPIDSVENMLGIAKDNAYYGYPFWNGTPPYALALAIYEGYDEIYMSGCDNLDPRHRRQLRSIAYLTGWARAKGVKVGGVTMNSGMPVRRYGYDFGPEWDAEQNAEMFDGWPFEVIFKNLMDWRKSP